MHKHLGIRELRDDGKFDTRATGTEVPYVRGQQKLERTSWGRSSAVRSPHSGMQDNRVQCPGIPVTAVAGRGEYQAVFCAGGLHTIPYYRPGVVRAGISVYRHLPPAGSFAAGVALTSCPASDTVNVHTVYKVSRSSGIL